MPSGISFTTQQTRNTNSLLQNNQGFLGSTSGSPLNSAYNLNSLNSMSVFPMLLQLVQLILQQLQGQQQPSGNTNQQAAQEEPSQAQTTGSGNTQTTTPPATNTNTNTNTNNQATDTDGQTSTANNPVTPPTTGNNTPVQTAPPQTETPNVSPPLVLPPKPPTSLAMTPTMDTILLNTFAGGKTGIVPQGQSVTVLDGTNNDGKFSSGDTVVVKDANGTEISRSQLSRNDMYDLQFRENMVSNVQSVGRGWDLAEGATSLVQIKDGKLPLPEVRSYQTANGTQALELVVERNNLWEVVVRNGQRHMVSRQTDDTGNTLQPANALRDLFNNQQKYGFDCATPMTVFNLKSSLDLLGDAEFNAGNGQIDLSGWYNQETGGYDGGYDGGVVRRANAGDIQVNGTQNLQGEYALFDANQGERLSVGSVYYFDKPGDTTSIIQGWNAVYLGQNQNGSHNFWSSSVGQLQVNFQDDSWVAADGFKNYYLGATVSDPNTNRLAAWDLDSSVA